MAGLRWCWQCLCLCGLVLGWGMAHGDTLSWQLDTAQRAAGAVTADALSVPQQGAIWQQVSLPDAWRLDHREGTWTYRWTWPTCPAQASAACLPKQPGAAIWIARSTPGLKLWVNGQEIEVSTAGQGQRPLLIAVPSALLADAATGRLNDVRLVVSGPLTQASGLSRVWVGAMAALAARHGWRDLVLLSGATATLSISAMLLLGGIWVAWRINAEAWPFAVVSFFFGAREALWLFGADLMAWDLALALAQLSCGVALLVACMTLLQLLDERAPVWLRLAFGVLAMLPLVIGWRVTHADSDAVVVWWYMSAQMLCLWITAVTIGWVLRKPSWPRVLILLGCVGVAVVNSLENWNNMQSPDALSFEHLRLTPLMALSALFVTCVAIYVRVSAALSLEVNHKAALQREIEAQRRELEALHARERERLQVQAVMDERARIVRDMHDGLGSQLVGMLSAVETDGFTRDELVDELQEALNQLRMTIDSLEPMGEDVSSVLGQLRYRLDARLRKAGFKVVWDVAPMPTDARLSASHVNHLQRLLYETFSNVIKHSGARHVWVEASHDDGRHKIVIRDDGCGFESGRPGGRGLHNLSHRASQLGAQLDIRSQPRQGTQVSLSWAINTP